MKPALLDILVCPSCLGELQGRFEHGQLVEGSLACRRCDLAFQVRNGVCVFGMRGDTKADTLQEIDGEHRWVCSANDVPSHVEYAKSSSEHTEQVLQTVLSRLGGRNPKSVRVLDVGCGWGAFQSWRFAQEGFDVVATEISPEFLFDAEQVVAEAYFERVVADGRVLPFKSGSFDVIVCKEFLHHLPQPAEMLQELWRVAAPNAILTVREPCVSVLMSKKEHRERDPAVKTGITHYHYSLHEYLTHLDAVADQTELNDGYFIRLDPNHHPILAPVQGGLWRLAAWINRRVALRVFLLLFGGGVSFVARRRATYTGATTTVGRDVIPIDLESLPSDAERTAFYRERLIPPVFDIFRDRWHKASTV